MKQTRSEKGTGSWSFLEDKGLYLYRYSFPDRKRRAFYGKTKAECMQKFRDFNEKLVKRGEKITKSTILEEYYKRYLAYIEGRIERTTYCTHIAYMSTIRKAKTDLFGMQLTSITTSNIQDFFLSYGGSISYNTARRIKGILRSVFDYAVEENVLESNPVLRVKLPKNQFKPKNKKGFFSSYEAREFTALIESEPNDLRLMLLFIVHTGVRAGELLGLRWKNVDIRSKTVRICENSVRIVKYNEDFVSEGSDKILKSPKTKAGERTIPLDEKALNIINHFKEYEHTEDTYVFRRKGLRVPSKEALRCQLDGLCRQADLPAVTPHELRHTFGSLLLEKGVDIKIVSKLMGHSSVSTTYDIYIHILDDKYADAINTLNEI